jgi:hypothetical protein
MLLYAYGRPPDLDAVVETVFHTFTFYMMV